jgi:hypothetical protein
MSNSIAVANVDDATAKWLGEEAERRGISTESLIAEVIRKGIGSKQPVNWAGLFLSQKAD